ESAEQRNLRMGCLGVHFALTADEVKHLKSFSSDKDRLDHLQNVIEAEYFSNRPDYLAENDKSWDAMHRCLSGGELTGGQFPLNHAVLDGELLYRGSDYIMSLKIPEQVTQISSALAKIDEADFRRRYFAIDEQSYGCPLSEHDFGYTW